MELVKGKPLLIFVCNSIVGALTEENLIFLEAWRTVDRAYYDKTFNGQSWFRYRENALRNEPMNTREETCEGYILLLLQAAGGLHLSVPKFMLAVAQRNLHIYVSFFLVCDLFLAFRETNSYFVLVVSVPSGSNAKSKSGI